jgi:DNA-directed RNA polymerase subunit RPC12/RpoP
MKVDERFKQYECSDCNNHIFLFVVYGKKVICPDCLIKTLTEKKKTEVK